MVLLVFLRSLSVTSVLPLDESHHDCSLSKFQSFVKIPVTYQSSHGTEVKSLRQGHCSIKESFVDIDNGEVFIHQMHISPYEKGNIFNKDPLRVRKLLLHKG